MAINTTLSKKTYTGNGVTTSFPIPFKFVDDSHIKVKAVTSTTSTDWVDGTDYTLTGAGVDSGGTLTAVAAPPSGTTLLIYRTVPLLQDLELVLTGEFNSENVEDRFDLIYMLIQQIAEGISPGTTTENLYLKYPDTEDSSVSSTLPNNADRLGKIFSFDAVTGEPTVTSIDSSSIGGLTGPSGQVNGNIALYSSTQGVIDQDNNIHRSLFDQQTLAYAATLDWDLDSGHIATITLGGNPTINIDNIKTGKCTLIVIQDSTGGRTITWGTGFTNTDNVSLNTDSNGVSVVDFISDGTNLYPIANSAGTKALSGLVGTYQDFAYDISSVEDDIGYLRCNGQAVSRTKYADLFSKISTTYGVGDGSTTFNLPDLETGGRFRRASATVGTLQADATAVNGLSVSISTNGSHSHSITNLRDSVDGVGSGDDVYGDENNTGTDITSTSTDGSHSHTATPSSTDSETRPINISCMVGIKF
jgi:microcystin-dependent protein